jgi:hypothetical protein
MDRRSHARHTSVPLRPEDPEPAWRTAVSAALSAYRSVAPLSPFAASPLAIFLITELCRGARGDTEAARLQRAAEQVDFAIISLRHVRNRLRERAAASTSLPLPLGHGADSAAEAGED